MGLEEIVKEIIYRKSYNAKKGIEAVKQVYDDSDTEKDAIKKATDRVLREIEEHPDMPVVDFLKMIQEDQELTTDIVVENISSRHIAWAVTCNLSQSPLF